MVRDRFATSSATSTLPGRWGIDRGGTCCAIARFDFRPARLGITVEINTSGFDNPAREFMPGWETRRPLLAEAGVPLTLGGDSRAPHHVGRHFASAVEGLHRLGVKGTHALQTAANRRSARRGDAGLNHLARYAALQNRVAERLFR